MMGGTSRGEQDEVVAFLGDPATHGGVPVERVETHGAIVFLAGDRVYKMKRAVKYPYMDFSTLDRRRRACEAELRLNRRTAPGLYLAVVPVVRRAGGLALDEEGEGEAMEWLVAMRRFPKEALLDRMAERGALSSDLAVPLAEQVAAFHAAAERCPSGEDFGSSGRCRAILAENLEGIAGDWFPADRLAALRTAAGRRLDRTAPLLDRRKAEGFVRRCHGDLHLRNICLLDGEPTLFDAIEFNETFAWIDVFDDAAFLLMDLDHRGLRNVANRFLTRYLLEAGDVEGLGTLPFFLANRALVRAKVALATAALTDDGNRREDLRRDAAAYVDAAGRYLFPPLPVLVAVGGVSGTGKTSVAAALAPGLGPVPGAIHLRSDVLRKRLLGRGETERLPESAYTPEMHERVFAELFRLAGTVLAAGHAVVIDGVFGRPEQRAEAAAVAHRAEVPFAGLWLEAPAAALEARVEARRGDASDATAAVVRAQLATDFGPVDWARVDAGRPLDDVVAAARAALADTLPRRGA